MPHKKSITIDKLVGNQSVIEPILVCQELSEERSVRTICEALDKVVKGGIIKLSPGVYRENLLIKVANIKIQASSPNTNVIIINGSHPSVRVDLSSDSDTVTLESIQFAHHANPSPQLIQNRMGGVDMDDQINCFKLGESMNTMVYIRKGKAIIQDCKFSLNVINPDNQSIIPCITIDRHGFLIMTHCELFGSTNSAKQTIGVLSKKGSAIIKECSFVAHKRAGIYSSGNSQTILKVSNSKIHHCGKGLIVIGDFGATIDNNTIEDCEDIGIKIGICNKSKISHNTITRNAVGIQFTNADPSINNNTITYSKVDGIVCCAQDMVKCDGQIKFNTIKQSKEVGIRCRGAMNEVKICNNHEISFNGKCGILVEKEAHPFIFRNRIEKNLGEGILISQGASGFIQKNEIENNLRANLALGGAQSVNTTIVNNKIVSSRCEGIFMIYAEKLLCSGNEISRNHQGIVAITSIPQIKENTISENERCGILMLEDCQSDIHKNIISGNKDAGLFLKDNSCGSVLKNQFKSNKYQLVVENFHSTLSDIDKDNQFEGEVRIPQNYRCNLI